MFGGLLEHKFDLHCHLDGGVWIRDQRPGTISAKRRPVRRVAEIGLDADMSNRGGDRRNASA
jgi:hypothetical protein